MSSQCQSVNVNLPEFNSGQDWNQNTSKDRDGEGQLRPEAPRLQRGIDSLVSQLIALALRFLINLLNQLLVMFMTMPPPRSGVLRYAAAPTMSR